MWISVYACGVYGCGVRVCVCEGVHEGVCGRVCLCVRVACVSGLQPLPGHHLSYILAALTMLVSGLLSVQSGASAGGVE